MGKIEAIRAKKKKYIPTILASEEVSSVFEGLTGQYLVIAKLSVNHSRFILGQHGNNWSILPLRTLSIRRIVSVEYMSPFQGFSVRGIVTTGLRRLHPWLQPATPFEVKVSTIRLLP